MQHSPWFQVSGHLDYMNKIDEILNVVGIRTKAHATLHSPDSLRQWVQIQKSTTQDKLSVSGSADSPAKTPDGGDSGIGDSVSEASAVDLKEMEASADPDLPTCETFKLHPEKVNQQSLNLDLKQEEDMTSNPDLKDCETILSSPEVKTEGNAANGGSSSSIDKEMQEETVIPESTESGSNASRSDTSDMTEKSSIDTSVNVSDLSDLVSSDLSVSPTQGKPAKS